MMHDALHNMHDALQPETLWILTFQQLNQARSSSAFSGELLLVRCSMSDSWKLIGQFVGKLLALKFMHFFSLKTIF